jgi:hypothetical protein
MSEDIKEIKKSQNRVEDNITKILLGMPKK